MGLNKKEMASYGIGAVGKDKNQMGKVQTMAVYWNIA